MAIKIVKVVEPMALRTGAQVMAMVRKARERADQEGTRIGKPKILITVEQEFDDGK